MSIHLPKPIEEFMSSENARDPTRWLHALRPMPS
jgi:hypothetical protein